MLMNVPARSLAVRRTDSVHVDQIPRAAEIRVRRYLPGGEAGELLKSRYQIINIWRPIGHNASDLSLTVFGWRTTSEKDFIKVDLLHPKRNVNDNDDRGKEVLPDASSITSTARYEPKDMTAGKLMSVKCFNSRSGWSRNSIKGLAHAAHHIAFVDHQTLADAPEE